MKSRFGIALLLTLGIASGVNAAQPPYFDISQPPQTRTDAPERIDLTELEANWWRYFEVEGAALEQRIDETIQRLETLAVDLPPRTVQTTRALFGRIRNNLLALPAARAQPSPAPPEPIGYQESYSVSALLALAKRQREVEAELEATRYNVAADDGAIKLGRQRIDNLTAEYLALPPQSPERLLHGLEIIADRSEIALAEEQLRVHKAALRAYETLLQQLANEQAVAASRLHAEYSDFQELNEDIAQARSVLDSAQEALKTARAEAAEARAVSLVEAGTKDEVTLLHRQQQIVHAMVSEASTQVKLYRLQTERLLVLLLLAPGDIDTQALREQVSGLRAQLSNIHGQIPLWTRESERERNLAGETMARAAADDSAVALNQRRLHFAQETLVAVQRLDESLAMTQLLIEQIDRQLAQREGLLKTWAVSAKAALKELWESTTEWIDLSLFKIGETPVTAEGLLRVALIILVAWLASYWFRRVLIRIGKRREGISQSALYTIARLSHYLIVTLGLFIGLSSIGIDFTNLALVAGAIGIGVGFGLQSIVANFVSGLILLFERSLKVGDFVQLASGVTGEVRSINVRSTIVTTNDNVDIVVPNLQFINGEVINWTLHEDYARIHVPFRVAYGADKEQVKKAALEAANQIAHTLKTRRPNVWLVDFAEDGIVFELVVWITPAAVKRPGAVNAEYRWEIETALHKYGIEIPVPQRDLRLRSDLKEFLKVLLNKEAA